MQVLVCLAGHAPGLVSKEQLLAEVWSDAPYVGEDVISHAVWELRKALGDSARQSRYIKTVPRRGYRVVAEVLRPQGSPVPMEGVRIDHYDIHEEIGRGSMGVVHKALDRRLDRTVAIKFLAPELTRDADANRRFQREARVAAAVDHANLATLFEIGETSEGCRYLVTPFYAGGSLKDRLGAGPVGLHEAIGLVRQLLAGLGAAHRKGVIHRDIKPANVMIDDHGTLVICDFGIAKLLGATDLTRTGSPLGTPAYKSPEQSRGRGIDLRTDLWAAGVVFFELLMGRRPFRGDYEHAVVHAILSEQPETLKDAAGRPVPQPVRAFLARALAKDPGERFQTAEEMASALGALEGRPAPPRPRIRRRGVAAALTAAVVVLSALGWALTPREGKREGEGWELIMEGRRSWLKGSDPVNLAKTRESFKRAVELMPESIAARSHLAAFLAESYGLNKGYDKGERDYARALELIRGVLEDKADEPLALAARAGLHLLRQELEEGESLARRARDIEPECADREMCDVAYLWHGEALWLLGRQPEALKVLEQGAKVGSGGVRCRLKKAQLLLSSGDERDAESEYLKVRAIDKGQTTANGELANFYLRERRFDDALRHLLDLYEVTRDPRALNNIGVAYYHEGHWKDALAAFQGVHQANKAAGQVRPNALTAIGDVYLEQGDQENAGPYYLEAFDIFDAMKTPGVRNRALRAVCLAKLGRFDQADAAMRLAEPEHDREDDFPDLLAYQARIAALKGDREALFELAGRWSEKERDPFLFLDDPAFIPYREDREYLKILEPWKFLDDLRGPPTAP